MNFAVISTDFLPMPGGVATWAFDVSSALHHAGHEVTVLSRVPPNRHHPFRMLQCWGRSWNSHRAKWVGLASLGLLNVDVAIFATWDSALWAAPILKSRGIRILCGAHGSRLTQANVSVKQLKTLAKSIDLWIPVSEVFKLSTFGNGFQIALRLSFLIPLTDKSPSPSTPSGPLLCAARCVDSKNIPFVIGLAKSLGRRLWLCRDGPRLEEYKQTYTNGVDYFGHLERDFMLRKLPETAGVLLCSKTNPNGAGAEGLGLCLLEAASYGIPTLGTAIGEIPEALGTGLLVDTDKPDLRAIEQYLTAPESGKKNWEWYHRHHGSKPFHQALEQLLSIRTPILMGYRPSYPSWRAQDIQVLHAAHSLSTLGHPVTLLANRFNADITSADILSSYGLSNVTPSISD